MSRRSRLSEKAFFEAYKKFTDISDPVPVLEHAAEAMKGLSRVADMEIEVKQLRETIDDYNTEIQVKMSCVSMLSLYGGCPLSSPEP